MMQHIAARPPDVLVVDDDPRLRDLLRRYLTQQGFAVVVAEDAQAMNRVMRYQRFDLMVLDLMMPGEDGLQVISRLRAAQSDLPVIVLTARGDESDRITGLEAGADDYLAKPFNPRELVARIQSVLRRSRLTEMPGAPSSEPQRMRFGQFELDLSTRSLRKAGTAIPLTTSDFATLKALARHAREPLSRQRLMQLSRGRDYESSDRSLDVQISRLRKLLEDDPHQPRYLQTVWGVGYVLIPDQDENTDSQVILEARMTASESSGALEG
ncbi:MAG: two-component system response regulator OmpR [Betaproteobacteria bacterium]|jgi:two-component system phosphate regulon response regulator OmpR